MAYLFRYAEGDAFDAEITDYRQEAGEVSIRNDGSRKVRPIHPGEMLGEDFLPDYGLSVTSFARALGVSRQTTNELLRERRAVSPQLALRLARLFGNSAAFWLNEQRAVDLWDAAQTVGNEVESIRPLTVAQPP